MTACRHVSQLLHARLSWQIRLDCNLKLHDAALQGRLYRSLKLWTFYCDLEESLGTLESARAVYDQILDLRIATPQIVLNYALFLEVCHKQTQMTSMVREQVFPQMWLHS